MIGSALPAGNHPVDAGEVKGWQRAKERLEREEPGGGRDSAEHVGAPGVVVASIDVPIQVFGSGHGGIQTRSPMLPSGVQPVISMRQTPWGVRR
jgi:hypothetical protein